MKKIARVGIALVLFAFLHNLISVFAAYWEEPGASKDVGEIYTTFADWEYFYHEDFEKNNSGTFIDHDGVRFAIDSPIIGFEDDVKIDGKGVILNALGKRMLIELPRGIGGFSFDFLANISSDVLKVSVYANLFEPEKEPIINKVITAEKDKVSNVRFDFNVSAFYNSTTEQKIFIAIESTTEAKVIIDNVKWSDYNINITFKDGYGENKVIATEYIRYGRLAGNVISSVEANNIKGYENFTWYIDPALETLFDLNTPIKENLTLYLDRDLSLYQIEYELNGGYFEPFEDRDEMVVAFLTDLYEYLDLNGKLQNTEFHQLLQNQGYADSIITIDDFIYGNGYSKENPNPNGTYEGIYNGLYSKGFVISDFIDEEHYPINYNLSDGYFADVGGSAFPNTDAMKTAFLTEFHKYIQENHGYTKPLNTFMHGSGKTSGFDGEYDIYMARLFEVNNKNINSSKPFFINQPEYNRWVPLLDIIDRYIKAVNPAQSFWGSRYEAGTRIKEYMQNKRRSESGNILNEIPQSITTGGTPQYIPSEYDGKEVITLPTPAKGNKEFVGWYEYSYDVAGNITGPTAITEIEQGRSGLINLYAQWEGETLPAATPYEEIPKMLREDSYFNQIYKMDDLGTENFDLTLRLSNNERKNIGLEPLNFFINQPEYNRWVPLIDLIHEYTIYGNPEQTFGVWKSYYTGAIRMEMFFQQYNPWIGSQQSELQYTVFEMLRRVPHTIASKKVTYSYTVESESITLPKPLKDQATFNNWYDNPEFQGDPITEIPLNSTGDKKYYALYNETKYPITYDLEGGNFAPYTNRDDLINDFLNDFYVFVEESLNSDFEVSLNDFKHGAGKTSGFNGLYTNYMYYSELIEAVPVQLMFATGNKTIDPQTNKFINQEDYNNRWLPLLELAADFTKAVNPAEDFWNDTKLASTRLNQLFRKVRPSGAPSSIDSFFNRIPDNISKEVIPHYHIHNEVSVLPIPVKEGHRFIGWYEGTTGQEIWTQINADVNRNLNFKAYWLPEGSYQVTYDFGLYGYQGMTHNELFLIFINNYISFYKYPPSFNEEMFFNDFFLYSSISYSSETIDKIFKYENSRWAWIEEYIKEVAIKEDYDSIDELNSYNELIWRLNLDAFFNSTLKTHTYKAGEEDITITSIDFSSLTNANGFWRNTSYNKYVEELIPGGDLFAEEFINNWHQGYEFGGWYDNPLFTGAKLENLPTKPTDNITLYAKWEQKEGFKDIVITFVDYEDNVIEVKYFNVGEPIEAPEDVPFREHYTHAGWDKDLSLITESTTVKALYTGHTYTLEFNTDGGTEITKQELVYPNPPTKPTDPEKSGYTFVSWYEEGFINEFFFNFPLYGNSDNDTITIYAKWEAIKYNITYVLGEGEVNHESNPTTYINSDVITLLPATKDNYMFMGWYSDDTYTTRVDLITGKIGDLTLYSKFDVYKYNVIFDPYGGAPAPDTQEVASGQMAVMPEVNPSKFGFTFKEWQLNGVRYDFNTAVTENISLTAYYEVSKYTVIFNDSNGVPINTQTINHGGFAVVIDVPDKLDGDDNPIYGYLKSWDPNLVNQPIEQNYTVNPKYELIEYNIIYHLDGGVNNSNNPVIYNKESNIALSSPTKEGYLFNGWYLESTFDNVITSINNRYGDLNLYASFTVEEYSITYILDGGVNHESNKDSYNINSFIVLEAATKPGYTFEGWYKDLDFNEKIEIISNQTGNLTLYAKYSEPLEFDIYYVLYEGELPNDLATFIDPVIKYKATIGAILSVPSERTSATFAGWYNNPSLTGSPVTEISTSETGHKTFYAKWDIKTYQVNIYNSKADITNEAVDPTKVISGILHSSVVNLEAYSGPVNENEEFIGWYYDNDILFENDQQINRDFDVYPQFGVKRYNVTFYDGFNIHAERVVYHGNTIPVMFMPTDPSSGTFEGWKTESGEAFDEYFVVTSNLVLLAKYAEGTTNYLVVFEYVDSSENVVQVALTIPNRALIIEDIPIIPSRDGYEFNNWTSNGDTYTTLVGVEINNNITFKANYTIKTYLVNFYSEGTLLEGPLNVTHGSNAVYTKATPVKENSIFIGWDKPLTNIKADTIFYAEFTDNKYIVRFYNYDDSLLQEVEVTHGGNVSPPTVPARAHYTHEGWDKSLENIENHTDIYATFVGVDYVLTYNLFDATTITETYKYPNRTVRRENPTRTGYSFVGWYLEPSSVNLYEFNEILTANKTIYAKWEIEQLTVKFMVDGVLFEERTVNYNTSVSAPNAPEKLGYTFTGWYNGEAKFEFTSLVTSNLTLIASFEPITLNVVYTNEDGTTYQEFVVAYGDTINTDSIPSLDPFVKAGYTVAWSLNLVNYIITSDLTINPKYTLITYTISYNNLPNGITHSNPTSYNVLSTIVLKDPVNIPEGNSFVGWYNGDTLVKLIGNSVTGNLALQARWEVTNYTITYNLDGGVFVGYTNRDDLINDFLTDFYNFLSSNNHISGISLTEFMHGTGETSGYDGFYGVFETDKTTYFDYLYSPKDRRVDSETGKFINQPEYNKWVPLLDLMEEYTALGEQSFWGSTYVGSRRIKPFIRKHNLWGEVVEQDTVDEITSKIPEGLLSGSIVYAYNLNTPAFTLLTPQKVNHEFVGWYTAKTGGTKVTSIPKGSTGNRVLYARWSIAVYAITYNLEGGLFTTYTTKTDMLDGFLQDFYDYLGTAVSEDLNTFMHGSGKTSGYAGLWHSKEAYKIKIYNGVEPTANNDNFFISATKYRVKWAPFFKMMETFTKINPEQSFWGGTYTGFARLKQYFTNVKPNATWTDANMQMMPNPAILLGEVATTYSENVRTIILPKPTRTDYRFLGWYTAKTGGTEVKTIPLGATGNKTFYARWENLVAYNDFTVKEITQSISYLNNINKKDENHPRKGTYGVIILSASFTGVTAEGWFDRWNSSTIQESTHVVVDDVDTIQLLPWGFKAYHTANTGNNYYVAVMISEISKTTPSYYYSGSTIVNYNVSAQESYFNAAWERAVAITVYILKHYNITTVNQSTVVGRHEAVDAGIALTAKANPGLLFSKHGKGMDDFRSDVYQRLVNG